MYGCTVPGEEWVLFLERVRNDARGGEVYSDRARVERLKVVGQKPIFQSQYRFRVRTL